MIAYGSNQSQMALFDINNIQDKIMPNHYYESSDVISPVFQIPFLKNVSDQ